MKPTERLKRWLALWNRRRLYRRQQMRRTPYAEWAAEHDLLGEGLSQALVARATVNGPLPAVDLLLLAPGPDSSGDEDALWRSLQAQWHGDWRLHVAAEGETAAAWQRRAAGDARLVLGAPAPMAARLAATSAPWLGVIDAAERWREPALLLLLEAAMRHPGTQAVYADEDRISPSGAALEPWFKPDHDPDALLAQDVLGSPLLMTRDRALAAGSDFAAQGPGPGHRALLATLGGLTREQVLHVPHVLARRVGQPGPVLPPPGDADAVRALLRANGEDGVETELAERGGGVRIRFGLPRPAPTVLLVIPTRNGLHLLRQCVDSIRRLTRYPAWRIVIVDNGSDDPACLAWMTAVAREDSRVTVRRDDRPFNFAALNNAAIADASAADCEFVALINNDIEVITAQWLDELVGLASRPGVGAVGARLWYGDHTLQHGGVLVDIGLGGGHVLKHSPREHGGPGGRQWRMQGYLAVTGACLLVRRAHYLAVGGMDEAAFGVACNDIDLCLKLVQAGHRTLWTPHAELFHHESVSRGKDHDPAKKQRLIEETARLRSRWPAWTARDPFHNPNLDLHSEQFALAREPRVGWSRAWWEGPAA